MSYADAAVAVIVPNYNKEKVLRTCLESIYAQTHQPAEVLVVDDRSTDSSRAIAKEFPCQLIELPINQGPAAARNIGAAASSAPLLFFVDSDTALLPDAIENAVRLLRQTPGCGMVQGIYHPDPLFDDGPVEAYRVLVEHFWRRRGVGRRMVTLFAASLITREAFDAAGGLDERFRQGGGEDVEFGSRLPAGCQVVVTDTVVTRHDDVDRFWPFVREQFGFAVGTPTILLRAWRRRNAGTGIRVNMMSPAGLALSGLGLLALPFGLIWPWLLVAGPFLLAAPIATSHEFLRYARRHRGAGFAAYAAGMHAVWYAVAVTGLGVGLLRAGLVLLRGGVR
jgi:glycosyltransferase involved in cell wall biosynthesis